MSFYSLEIYGDNIPKSQKAGTTFYRKVLRIKFKIVFRHKRSAINAANMVYITMTLIYINILEGYIELTINHNKSSNYDIYGYKYIIILHM